MAKLLSPQVVEDIPGSHGVNTFRYVLTLALKLSTHSVGLSATSLTIGKTGRHAAFEHRAHQRPGSVPAAPHTTHPLVAQTEHVIMVLLSHEECTDLLIFILFFTSNFLRHNFATMPIYEPFIYGFLQYLKNFLLITHFVYDREYLLCSSTVHG